MMTRFIFLPLFLAAFSASAQIMIIEPNITFYSNGAPPASYSQLRVLDYITINLADSVGGSYKTVARAAVQGDSLIIYPDTSGIIALAYDLAPPIYLGGYRTILPYPAFIGLSLPTACAVLSLRRAGSASCPE
jgi:hypothetical protein